jgi:hypothetical protein
MLAKDGDGASGMSKAPHETKSREPGQWERKNQHNNNRSNKAVVPRQQKFEGEYDELKGNIYDCSDARQADLFTKTSKAIAGHVGRSYKYSGDIRITVETLAVPTMEVPSDPPDTASKTEVKIWEK